MLNHRKIFNALCIAERYACKRSIRSQARVRIVKVVQPADEDEMASPVPPKTESEFSNLDLGLNRKVPPTITKTQNPLEMKPLKNKFSFSVVTEENMYELVNDVVVPLAKIPYFKQLKIKQKNCMTVLQELTTKLRTGKIFLQKDRRGLPCPLDPVRPSPENVAYRNKDEFGIRHGVDGNPKTVGFFIGSPSDNSQVICVHPKELINTKPVHLRAAELFQEYIRQSSLRACIDFREGGNWRNLLVKSNIYGDLMLVIVMHPQNLSEEEINDEKMKLREYFMEGPGKELNIQSLIFQACRQTRCNNEQAPFQLLAGEPYIFEDVGHLRLRVSPETFTQVNTSGATVLYDTISELAGATSSTTVLDACCGAGTTGMYLASKASRVIGIDSSSQAIEDAKYNVKMNDVKNMAVLHGEAELIVPKILDDMYSDDLVAVINPSGSGIKRSIINVLRECKHLRRIVFVSSKPGGGAMNNFIQLCSSAKKNPKLGPPFAPLYAVPVDLFPHTNHCELVIMFERTTD